MNELWRLSVGVMVLLLSSGCQSTGSAGPSAPADPPGVVVDPKPPVQASNLVSIDNFTFAPASLTVPVGTQVTWINHDDVPHTVTSADNPRVFHSGTLDTDEKFVFTFNKPGVYKYYCLIHSHMTGTIIVK